ncbi:MAG: right-handed parallel beta-helix repeat-containing protein [Polyangiaceae bacterium]
MISPKPQGVIATGSRRSAAPGLFFGALGFLGSWLATGSALATEYYVSPTGSDTAAGTMAAPFATIQKAGSTASPGDTVWLRAGTYYNTAQITISKSGQSDASNIKFWAYANEVPVLDCSKYKTTNAAVDMPCILITGSWLHFRGLEVANGPVGASGAHSIDMVRVKNAQHDTFELLNIHHGFGPGLFFDGGTGGHLVLNCDSHDNYDKNGSQGDGQNADGFGVHYQMSGPSTVIRGCRAWLDSDDGYDLIGQEVSVRVENSFAAQNGYANGGSTSPADGNGNGFKMGSSQVSGCRHIVQNNVAWKNKASGFYANHSTGGNTWYNNTAYMNNPQYNMLASSFDANGGITGTIVLSGSKAHIMRNNIGFPNKNSNMSGVDSMSNTWDLNITEAASDFVSTSDANCLGPRQADGSMPAACTFLKLKAGSPLIDKGKDVMLPFVGAAPDLGAYEYGAVAPMGGSGGAPGGAGAAGAGVAGAGVAGGNPSAGVGGGASGGQPSEGIAGASVAPVASAGSGGSDSPTAGAPPVSGGAPGNETAGQAAIAGSGTAPDAGSTDNGCNCVIAAGARAGDPARGARLFGLVAALACVLLARPRRRRNERRS